MSNNLQWNYSDLGLSREQAEERVLSLGFVPTKAGQRGWEKPTEWHVKRRYHVVPSDGYMNIHADSKYHHVAIGKNIRARIEDIIRQLSRDNLAASE